MARRGWLNYALRCGGVDFAGISDIGQAFADELFRVFAAAHPAIRITPINTEPAVAQMIRRVVAAGTQV